MMSVILSKKDTGFSMIELMVTVAVLSIIVAFAVPSYNEMIQKRQLKGVAETLYANLQFAKIESIKRNMGIRVDFTVTNAATWCYGLNDLDADSDGVVDNCTCTTTDSCQINGVEKVVSSDDYQNINIVTTSVPWGAGSSFDPVRGTIFSSSATFFSDFFSIKVMTSSLGRIKICNVTSSPPMPNLPGYPSC